MENEDWTSEESQNRCVACERDIQLGEDALVVEEGVLGHHGLVPLKEVLWFCSEDCIAAHFDEEQRTRESKSLDDRNALDPSEREEDDSQNQVSDDL